jgi:hypothetical protein
VLNKARASTQDLAASALGLAKTQACRQTAAAGA